MSKNKAFGKFVLFCALVGAVAAGVYYYLSKREEEIADSFDDDDFDDFEDFDDDDDLGSDTKFGSRKYVDITSGSDESEDDDEGDLDDEDEPAQSEEFFDDENN